MITILIILIAVINFAQDVSDVDVLTNLPSQALQCSVKFDRKFVANNDAVAAAVEALLEENQSEEQGASRRDKPCDSDPETEEDESEGEPLLRRELRGKGRGKRGRRNRNDVTLEAGATRPPRGDKPCDSDSVEEIEEDESAETATGEEPLLRRELRKRGRRGRRNRKDVTLEAGATRPPRGDKPCDSDSDEETEEESVEEPLLRRELRGGRRGRRNRKDVTLEAGATRPPRDEDSQSAEETAVLGRRERRDRNDVTLEAGATRPPRGDKPCDSDSAETEEAGADPVLRRLLRRDQDSSETDAEIAEVDGETGATEEPRKRGRERGRENRRKGTTPERRSPSLDAVISDGSLEIAGLTGEVVFGSVDVDMESIALTITFEGTSFTCDVEVRRGNKVSCRAASEDDFHLRVECELPADEA